MTSSKDWKKTSQALNMTAHGDRCSQHWKLMLYLPSILFFTGKFELMLVIAIFFRDVVTILQVPSVKDVKLVFMVMPHKELL